MWMWQGQLWATGNIYHLMFITAFFLVWTVDHMYPYIKNWVNKAAHLPREFELSTYQFECDTLTFWANCNNMKNWMWKSNREMARGFSRTCRKGGRLFWSYVDLSMLFAQYLSWNLIALLPGLSILI